MTYTIKEIDTAIETITGFPVKQWPGWSRTLEIDRAAAKAFFDLYPEDDHTNVLREARWDLSTKGFFQPRDGEWPDE